MLDCRLGAWCCLGAPEFAQAHLFFNSFSMNKNAKAVKHSIVHGNCLELMQKIPDNYVDFICADFPYNISGRSGLTMR